MTYFGVKTCSHVSRLKKKLDAATGIPFGSQTMVIEILIFEK